MKSEELKKYTIKELQKLLHEKRVELTKLKIEVKLNKTNAIHNVKRLKTEVARIITELNSKRLEITK